MNLELKKEKLKTNKNKYKLLVSELKSLLYFEGFEDFLISPNYSYENIIINIQHSKYQLSEFIICTLSIKKGFDFINTTGSFNHSVPIDNKILIMKKSFIIVEKIKLLSDKILSNYKEYLKIDKENQSLNYKIKNGCKEQAMKKAYVQIEKTHTSVTIREIVVMLNSGGDIKVSIPKMITKDNLPEIIYIDKIIENRKVLNKNNFFYDNNHYSKDSLIYSLISTNIYIKKKVKEIK